MKKTKKHPGTLRHEDGEDYILEGERAWITVKNLSVEVKMGDEGVSVHVFPKGYEDGEVLTETWATYGEGEVDLCDCGHTANDHKTLEFTNKSSKVKKTTKCGACECPSFRACD
jgi:hypothetical protein